MNLYILLIILIFLIVFLIFLNYNNINDLFYNLYTNFNEYRLGDVYNGDAGKENEKWLYNHHIKNFPKSIASEYLKKTNKKKDITVMSDIIKNRLNNIIIYPCVLHIRIGDVLEDLEYNKIIEEWNNNKINNKKGNFLIK